MHGILPSPFTVQVNQEARERRYGGAREYHQASIASDEVAVMVRFKRVELGRKRSRDGFSEGFRVQRIGVTASMTCLSRDRRCDLLL